MKLCGLILNFYIHVFVSYWYILTIGPQTEDSKIGGQIVGIYKSLTDTWTQTLGTRPHSFISGNICFEFSVQCRLKKVQAQTDLMLPILVQAAKVKKCRIRTIQVKKSKYKQPKYKQSDRNSSKSSRSTIY